MFECIYIEKSLCPELNANMDAGEKRIDCPKMENEAWIKEYRVAFPKGNIEYVECVEVEVLAKTLLIGETQKFLEVGRLLKLPVLAVLTKQHEDLFSYPYAVCSLSDITLDYLELIQCRFEMRPYKVMETERLTLLEMDMESAVEYFSLKQTEPQFFVQENESEDIACLFKNEQEMEVLARAYVEHVYPFYGYGIWAVYHKQSGMRIGFAGLVQQDGLKLSYYIKRAYRRNGYATECCRAILQYVKTELEDEPVCCQIAADNVASLGVAQKLGVKVQVV